MDVVKLALVMISGLGLFLLVFPTDILKVFLVDLDARNVAIKPLQFTGIFIGLDAAGLVLMNALLGAGDSRRVMFVSIATQWFFFLPAAYLAGPVLGYGLLGVWILQGLYRLLQAAFFYQIWRKRSWASINL